MKAAQSIFIPVNILHFINQKIVLAGRIKSGRDIIVEFSRVSYVVKLKKFFVDVYNSSIRPILIKPTAKLTKHETFTYTALTDKYYHHPTVEMRNDVRQI